MISLSSGTKFVLVFILLFFISNTINKWFTYFYKADILPSQKFLSVAVFSIMFAWIIIFDIKGIAFSNNIVSTGNIVMFSITVFFFYYYNGLTLHFDMKHQNLNPEVPVYLVCPNGKIKKLKLWENEQT